MASLAGRGEGREGATAERCYYYCSNSNSFSFLSARSNKFLRPAFLGGGGRRSRSGGVRPSAHCVCAPGQIVEHSSAGRGISVDKGWPGGHYITVFL